MHFLYLLIALHTSTFAMGKKPPVTDWFDLESTQGTYELDKQSSKEFCSESEVVSASNMEKRLNVGSTSYKQINGNTYVEETLGGLCKEYYTNWIKGREIFQKHQEKCAFPPHNITIRESIEFPLSGSFQMIQHYENGNCYFKKR